MDINLIKAAYQNGDIKESDLYNGVLSGKLGTSDYKEIVGYECGELPLDVVKELKIKEISKICNSEILSGFRSSAKDNVEKLYDFDMENQINLSNLFTNICLGILVDGTIEYYAKGEPCTVYSNDEIKALYTDAMIFKTGRIKKYKLLKEAVMGSETKEEIEMITW